MAASGHTNRQVARALFLSPRTVEADLARVYRKLGAILTGRTRRSHGPQRARPARALTAVLAKTLQQHYWVANGTARKPLSCAARARFAAPTTQNTTPSRTITPNTPSVTDSKNTRDTPKLLVIE